MFRAVSSLLPKSLVGIEAFAVGTSLIKANSKIINQSDTDFDRNFGSNACVNLRNIFRH